MAVKILMLTKKKAAEYLGCSVEELEKWVKPDRVNNYSNPVAGGMRLWSGLTLDAAKPNIQGWRERDRVASEIRGREFEAAQAAQRARRKGMRKGSALMATKVREALSCTRAELDRWASDGRLPPNGEIFVHGGGTRKSVNARALAPRNNRGRKGSNNGMA
jgi:hypothetical protein